jgi:ParB/RepB/Spo0J family partition protein
MSKAGFKVSGLVANGKLSPMAGVMPSGTFGRAEEQAPDSLVPGQEYMIRLDKLVDSPFQIRLVIDPARVDEVGQQLDSQGQIDPIEFRPGKTPNTFEIVKGHTRKRAAASIGWTEIRGLYKELTDAQADVACMVDNTGATPSEFEYALMFRRALTKGYVNTQAEAGKMFGVSQSQVSKGLAMLELPPAILAMLNIDPGLFGAKASVVIQTLWYDHPEHHDIILETIAGLKDGMEQIEIKGRVEQRIAEVKRKELANAAASIPKPPKQQARREVINSPTGNECYVTILKDKAMVIEFKDLAIPATMAQEVVNKALKQLAESYQPAGNGE